MDKDSWLIVLQICGEKYSFQNILVCTEFYDIVKNRLNFSGKVYHDISTKYNYIYFDFYYMDLSGYIHLPQYIYIDIMENMNSSLFIYFVESYYDNYYVSKKRFKKIIEDEIYAYDANNKCDIMDLIRTYDTNTITINIDRFNEIKHMEIILDYMYE